MRVVYTIRRRIFTGFVAGDSHELAVQHETDDLTLRDFGSGAQTALDGTEEEDLERIEETVAVNTGLIPAGLEPIWLMMFASVMGGQPFIVDLRSDIAGVAVQPLAAKLISGQQIRPIKPPNAPLYRRFNFRVKVFV